MDLYKDILVEVLSKQKIKVVFENLQTDNPAAVTEKICYKTIQSIRRVLDNEKLDDYQCIERIVRLLEKMGSDGGIRHDFG